MVLSVNVFATTEKLDIAVTYKNLSDTEQEALELGLAKEAKIKAGKFKSYHRNQCDSFSRVKYYTKNVEIKKLYVDGVAKYKTTVNAIMECELEYDM